jgi:methyl-accepting chemotaxis protein
MSSNRRFSIAQKVVIVATTYVLPIGVLLFLVVSNINEFIRFAQWEQRGTAYQRPLESALDGVLRHQIFVHGRTDDAAAKVTAARSDADRAFDALEIVDRRIGADLQFTEEGLAKRDRAHCRVDAVRKQWNEIAEMAVGSSGKPSADIDTKYTKLIADLRMMITHSGDTSNLILDPDLDSYYLMDVTLLALPQLQERTGKMMNLVGDILTRGAPTAEERTEIAVQAALLETDLERAIASTQTSLNEDANFYGVSPTLKGQLEPSLAEYKKAAATFIGLTRKAAGTSSDEVVPQAYVTAGLAAHAASFKFWDVAENELDKLLATRVGSYTNRRTMSLSLAGLAIAIATGLACLTSLSITRPLNKLVRTLGPGASLLQVSVQRIADASKSRTASPEQAELICEELNAHADDMRSTVGELESLVRGNSASVARAPESGKALHTPASTSA